MGIANKNGKRAKTLWLSGSQEKAVQDFCTGDDPKLDTTLLPYDIWTNKAHLAMLHQEGILKTSEVRALAKALDRVEASPPAVENFEDVHSAIEFAVSEIIGKSAGNLHIGRSRNDQVITDTHLFLRDQALAIQAAILSFQSALIKLAKRHLKTVMAGHTHYRQAQPITFGFLLASYVAALERDAARLEDFYNRINVNPLGAAALAGTSWPIDPTATSRFFGFATERKNSLDTVTNRGELEAEFLSILAILMNHLSTIAQDLLVMNMEEIGWVAIDRKFCTGSSIMPNKSNPDPLEILKGKTALMHGKLLSVLSICSFNISGFNRNTQLTKGVLIASAADALASTITLEKIISTLKINAAKMKADCRKETLATDMADALVLQGKSFREAHHHVASNLKETAGDIAASVNSKKFGRGPAPSAVTASIEDLNKTISRSARLLNSRKTSITAAKGTLGNYLRDF